jgi:hypothetical protein
MAAALSVTACDTGSMTGTAPGGNSPNVFSDQIGLGGFSTILSSGTSRVFIRMIPGTLTASGVRVRQGDQINQVERIVSEVETLDTGATGDVILSLGGIKVTFDATTKFEGWHDDMDSDDSAAMGEAGFIGRLQAALAAGHHPSVVALRQPPSAVQGPNDSTFFAQVLRLDDDADRPTIEMNVTAANLTTNSTPPPDAFLTVLGRPIGLDVTGGKTRIDANRRNTMGAVHFEGRVQSVDTLGGTATLADSTVIKVPMGGEIEHPDRGDDDDNTPLNNLSGVAAALAAGDTVDAAGFGLKAGTDTIDAVEVRFRIRDFHEFEPMVIGFEGKVMIVDTMAGRVTLDDGRTVDVTDSTHFITLDGGLPNLAAVLQALGDTALRVRTEGAGKPVSATEVLALFIRFEADSGGEHH